ncbi:MAG: hypothetical protein WB799_03535 [Candidatus Sulfotelmatobacter sp.]
MEEQRRRVRSSNPAERFAAALLLPAELSRRLRLLSDFQIAALLEHEVCPNMSLLAPEAPICVEAALRLQRLPKLNHRRVKKASRSSRQFQGEHIMHAEAALYRAGIPNLLLPFQKDRFASCTFFVNDVEQARTRLLEAGFREVSRCATALIHVGTRQAIHLYEDRTQLYLGDEEKLSR